VGTHDYDAPRHLTNSRISGLIVDTNQVPQSGQELCSLAERGNKGGA
jgi:hypothetical protein